MNKLKNWVIFVCFTMVIIIYFDDTIKTHVNKSDIDTTYVSLNEQQKIVLKFENELVCNYHSLCFDSVVDGAMQANPARASQNCKIALQGICTYLFESLCYRYAGTLDVARAAHDDGAWWGPSDDP